MSGAGDYTEVTSQGWFSRIGDAFKGLVVGLILFAVSFVLLFWNEGRAVRTAKSLAEGAAAVVPVGNDRVDPSHDRKLVHVSGLATTDQTVKDPQFGVSAKAIRLQRITKMYQWKETSETRTRKKLGGGEERTTTYTYSKAWEESPIDSGRFKHPEGHENPAAKPVEDWSADADPVTLGAFRLSPGLVAQIRDSEPLPVDAAGLEGLPADLKERMKVESGHYFLGDDAKAPQVGDTTVEFRQVKPTTVSLLSQQVGDSFQPYRTKAGDAIDRLQVGQASAEAMFQAAVAENVVITWILRLVGWILMAIGIALVLGPISVFADVVPIFGDIAGFGIGLIAFGLALVLSLATIAVGWLAFRPLLGGSLLALAVAALVGLVVLARGRRRPLPAKPIVAPE